MMKFIPNVAPISNDKKAYYKFSVTKNMDKGGAWCAYYVVTNREGSVTEISSEAFSNAGAAKRWCAAAINRKSIRWTQPNAEDKTVLNAVVEVKKVIGEAE